MADAVVTLGLDVAQLKRGLETVRRDVEKFGQSTKKSLAASTGGGLAGAGKSIAGALAGLAVGSKITSTINEYARLADLSARLGVSAESIQRVGIAAEQSGTDAETAARALTLLTKALDNPDNKKASEAFQELGVNLNELRAADAFQQVRILATAFQKAQSTGTGFAAIMDLLGKSGAELIPLLRMTGEEMDAIAQKDIISDDQIARIAKLDDRMVELSRTVSVGVGSTIAWMADKWESAVDGITTKVLQAQVIVDSLFAGKGPTAALQEGAKFAQDMANAKIKESKEAAEAEQRALEAKKESLAITKEITKEEKKAEKPTGADTNGDGFTSKREQRVFDLAQERGQRKADSIKGFSRKARGLSAFAGLAELQEMSAMQVYQGAESVGQRWRGVKSTSDPRSWSITPNLQSAFGGRAPDSSSDRVAAEIRELKELMRERLTVD